MCVRVYNAFTQYVDNGTIDDIPDSLIVFSGSVEGDNPIAVIWDFTVMVFYAAVWSLTWPMQLLLTPVAALALIMRYRREKEDERTAIMEKLKQGSI